MDVAAIYVVSCDGPTLQIVDLVLCRAPTKPVPRDKLDYIVREMSTAAAADRVRRERRGL